MIFVVSNENFHSEPFSVVSNEHFHLKPFFVKRFFVQKNESEKKFDECPQRGENDREE